MEPPHFVEGEDKDGGGNRLLADLLHESQPAVRVGPRTGAAAAPS